MEKTLLTAILCRITDIHTAIGLHGRYETFIKVQVFFYENVKWHDDRTKYFDVMSITREIYMEPHYNHISCTKGTHGVRHSTRPNPLEP
jgi:hypothetical protein